MGWTFVGVSTTPVDGGSNQTQQISLSFPTGTQVGDLIYLYFSARDNYTAGINIGNSGWSQVAPASLGGIQFTTLVGINGVNTLWGAPFWFQLPSSWSGQTSITFSYAGQFGGSGCTAGQMLVFRPTVSGDLIRLVGFQTSTASTAIPSITMPSTNGLAIASWQSNDDNTWGSLSGTNWSKTGLAAQYRNLGGSDQSTTFAYNLTANTSSNAVSQSQLTLGPDTFFGLQIGFQHYTDNARNNISSDFFSFL